MDNQVRLLFPFLAFYLIKQKMAYQVRRDRLCQERMMLC